MYDQSFRKTATTALRNQLDKLDQPDLNFEVWKQNTIKNLNSFFGENNEKAKQIALLSDTNEKKITTKIYHKITNSKTPKQRAKDLMANYILELNRFGQSETDNTLFENLKEHFETRQRDSVINLLEKQLQPKDITTIKNTINSESAPTEKQAKVKSVLLQYDKEELAHVVNDLLLK